MEVYKCRIVPVSRIVLMLQRKEDEKTVLEQTLPSCEEIVKLKF